MREIVSALVDVKELQVRDVDLECGRRDGLTVGIEGKGVDDQRAETVEGADEIDKCVGRYGLDGRNIEEVEVR